MAAAVLCLTAAAAQAHEFWIDAERWQVAPGSDVAADFRVGEDFAGGAFSYIPARSARLDLRTAEGTEAIAARVGDLPAVTLEALPEGLATVIHETGESRLVYRDKGGRTGWERFTGFLDHKAMTGIAEAHLAAGLPREGVSEGFTRYAKALIGVGDAGGADAPTGLRTEIVTLANPYRDDLSGGLPVRVLLDGAPRAGAQVELFARAPDGTVTVTTHDADGGGVAVLPVEPGHAYLADSVAMVPGPGYAGGDGGGDGDGDGPMWRSLWAALTFAVPEGQ